MRRSLALLRQITTIVLCLVPLLAAACGTLEIGIEPTATPSVLDSARVSTTATAVPTETPATTPLLATPTPTRSPQRTRSPTPKPALTSTRETFALQVAFVKDGNISLWTGRPAPGADRPSDTEPQEAILLTSAEGVSEFKMSDDGQIVAFERDGELWAIRSDGTGERKLVNVDDFAAMEPTNPGVMLWRFEWVPDTHTLAFNTRLRTRMGVTLSDDLRLVDADSLEQTILLAPGQGGEFHYSPDGRQVAIVTPSSMGLLDIGGENPRNVFDYAPQVTGSGSPYYLRPVWAADSGSLWVAVPPADLETQPSEPTGLWTIHTDGTSATFYGNILADPKSQLALSPDLSHVAYLADQGRLLVTDLDTGETIPYHIKADDLYGWSPDSQRFAFSAQAEPAPRAHIVQLGIDAVPAHSDTEVAALNVSWVDAYHYLYLVNKPQGWDLVLGEFGGFSTLVAAGVDGPTRYDFARSASPTPAGPASSDTVTPTPTPVSDLATQLFDAPNGDIAGLSADGRYVLLESMSIELIERGQPAEPDIPRVFLYDRDTGTTALVSATSNGMPADFWSIEAALSSDGSTVAFWSFARNLAYGEDVSDCPDVGPGEPCGSLYIYDVPSGTLERIPVGAGYGLGMANATALSADGRYVAFATQGGAVWDGTMLLDREMGEIAQISPTGLAVDLSADGRTIAFVSADSDLVAGDTNEALDVFVLDRETAQVERISAPRGGQGSDQHSGVASFVEGTSAELDISPDGRYVVFASGASDLVEAALSPCMLYPGKELPACRHVYLYDRETGVTELISLSDDGVPGDGVSSRGRISPSGRWVAFTSAAGNLTPEGPSCRDYGPGGGNCPQVFVRDRQRGQTHLVSVGWDGQLANSASLSEFITADGDHVLFRSYASNLLPGTEGGFFVADLPALIGKE